MDLFKQRKQTSKRSSSSAQSQGGGGSPKHPLLTSLRDNLQRIKDALGSSEDLIIRQFRIGKEGKIQAAICYMDGLTDTKSIQNFIMGSLMQEMRLTDLEQITDTDPDVLQLIKDYALSVGDLKEAADFETLFNSLLSGNAILLLEGHMQSLVIGISEWEDRAVAEPSSQTVIRGPRDGFTETLRTNTSLLRRKIKDPNLWLESRKIGRVTKTDVAMMYIKGIASDKIVQEVRSRLDRIDIDGILESGYIEELIQDETRTPFPTLYNTERPDVVAAGLLEGRVAILVDGTPFVLLAPVIFAQFYQSPEDYYQRADAGTLIRFLRYLSLFIALLGPSLYIAITTFHQEMLPTPLLISLAAQREGVPFPAFIEALMMEVTFEILREAGVRMPRAVGQAISIVGALVIGQAAVEAGIVSAAMVIVVSITAISSFVFPSFNMAISIRMLRFFLMGLAASFGLFGITVGLIALVLHLCSLRSFGVPYMSPFAPFIAADQKDAVFRFPQWALFARPRLISQKNVIREQNSPTPKPDN
ncbi:spore germination protein [Paenibacillus beijingensis]|uniref:Spore gernimation protein KA n=1 Tax=Paenibacillus beijingensis TaxID=1126833 RepID=A0A0D5NJ61_9BACL|nr:spore germination protein [Paenibacillus beijingensis]AJY75120.1 spore gernimation protein KA [Paenibacillus beijingensis]